MYRKILAGFLVLGTLAACDDTTTPAGTATLDIAFATASTTVMDGDLAALQVDGPLYAMDVSGTNGTLTIDEIHVIVSELELEGVVGACDEPAGSEDDDEEDDLEDCEEFESPPSLVQIPADGTPLVVATGAVPLGTYTGLEWEVEDVSLDEEDEDEAELEAVRADIESVFGAGVWPDEASMAIVGSFLADGETEPVEFTTFFDAEIEVEMPIDPALEITEEGASRELKVVLSPDVWFTNADGTVMNLAALSGQLVEFEAEFEDGVLEIEHDD